MIIQTVESSQATPKLENSIIWCEIFGSLPPARTFTHNSDSLLKDFLLSPRSCHYISTFHASYERWRAFQCINKCKNWLHINCFDTFKLHYKVLIFIFLQNHIVHLHYRHAPPGGCDPCSGIGRSKETTQPEWASHVLYNQPLPGGMHTESQAPF